MFKTDLDWRSLGGRLASSLLLEDCWSTEAHERLTLGLVDGVFGRFSKCTDDGTRRLTIDC